MLNLYIILLVCVSLAQRTVILKVSVWSKIVGVCRFESVELVEGLCWDIVESYSCCCWLVAWLFVFKVGLLAKTVNWGFSSCCCRCCYFNFIYCSLLCCCLSICKIDGVIIKTATKQSWGLTIFSFFPFCFIYLEIFSVVLLYFNFQAVCTFW